MIEDFPQFEPLPVRAEPETGDKEIWQPSWKCYCCQDTGKIQPHLVRLVVPNYDYNRDRIPICQLCECGDKLYHLNQLGVIDTRFELLLCKKLDAIARDQWRVTTQKQFEIMRKRVDIASSEIAKTHSLTKGDRLRPAGGNRTDNDNREVQQRKAEIGAISPKQWAVTRTSS